MSKASTSIPKADRVDGEDFNDFLKASDIGKLGEKATLIMTGNMHMSDTGDYGPQIMVEVKHGTAMFDFPVKLNKRNHRILEDMYGTDAKKWKGKKLTIEIKHFKANDYIAIVK